MNTHTTAGATTGLHIPIRPTILLFGDSITEFGYGQTSTDPMDQIGWSSLLSATYSRRADVLSRGFSGYNTRHALSILPEIIGRGIGNGGGSGGGGPRLLFCTIFFGANDASLPSARQHLPIKEFEANMRNIISYIRTTSSSNNTLSNNNNDEDGGKNESNNIHPTIILMTPPPVSPKAWDNYCVQTSRPLSPRSNEQSKQYGNVILQIGNEMDCPVVDTFQLLDGDDTNDEKEYKHTTKYLTDGLHLTGEGNRIVFQGLMNVIQTQCGDKLMPMVDGDGRYGSLGVPLEHKLWHELC